MCGETDSITRWSCREPALIVTTCRGQGGYQASRKEKGFEQMNEKRISRWAASVGVVIAVAAIISGCALFGKSDHAKEIRMDQLPPAVKAAAEKETAGCRIIEVEEELKDGKTIYAITYDERGTEMEIEYSTDAVLLSKGPE
jgi:hypothetical protein